VEDEETMPEEEMPALRQMVRTGSPDREAPEVLQEACLQEILRGGAGMYHIKEMLGHESLDTLKHYAKLTIIDLKNAHARCHPREKDDCRGDA